MCILVIQLEYCVYVVCWQPLSFHIIASRSLQSKLHSNHTHLSKAVQQIEKVENKGKDFWNYCFKLNDLYPMDLISIPFSPRYKSNARIVLFILGGRLNDEDIIQEIYQKGLCMSQKKIASFLEDENYVMRNTFPSIQKCGFVSC